ncbi:MAG: hypothetical protein PWP48_540 [Clostridiales bacterium]|jgi:hypothetical protein|nr:hypothetical protein [Clostridiales bacterium]
MDIKIAPSLMCADPLRLETPWNSCSSPGPIRIFIYLEFLGIFCNL